MLQFGKNRAQLLRFSLGQFAIERCLLRISVALVGCKTPQPRRLDRVANNADAVEISRAKVRQSENLALIRSKPAPSQRLGIIARYADSALVQGPKVVLRRYAPINWRNGWTSSLSGAPARARSWIAAIDFPFGSHKLE